jgi:hypothetical protein
VLQTSEVGNVLVASEVGNLVLVASEVGNLRLASEREREREGERGVLEALQSIDYSTSVTYDTSFPILTSLPTLY